MANSLVGTVSLSIVKIKSQYRKFQVTVPGHYPCFVSFFLYKHMEESLWIPKVITYANIVTLRCHFGTLSISEMVCNRC